MEYIHYYIFVLWVYIRLSPLLLMKAIFWYTIAPIDFETPCYVCIQQGILMPSYAVNLAAPENWTNRFVFKKSSRPARRMRFAVESVNVEKVTLLELQSTESKLSTVRRHSRSLASVLANLIYAILQQFAVPKALIQRSHTTH